MDNKIYRHTCTGSMQNKGYSFFIVVDQIYFAHEET